jgi:hypothetical protein
MELKVSDIMDIKSELLEGEWWNAMVRIGLQLEVKPP